ncbi:MAG: glycosyltransferase family 2 protein [Lewinellaceae bacterium]|nr:glycosyltransferase family 2 protein [Lewinellaceae bacterium]
MIGQIDGDSIQDVLNQTFTEFELIICDDASTDGTEKICREFAQTDTRIRYNRQPTNLGMPGNLIDGIKKARFPYIAILHDADRFSPRLLERWYRAIVSSPDIGFVFNSMGTLNEQETLLTFFMEFGEGQISGRHLLENVYFRRWHFNSPVYGEAMVRKSVLEDLNYLDGRFGFYADVDLWMRILQKNDAYYCREILISRPDKTSVPRLFSDTMVKTYFLMRKTHFENRVARFGRKPVRFAAEMIRLAWYNLLNIIYIILIHIKNHNLQGYLSLFRAVKGKSPVFLLLLTCLLPLKLILPKPVNVKLRPG